MAGSARRGRREFARLPPGVVRVRLEGQSGPGLASRIAAIPGLTVLTGPDLYPGDRVYLLVSENTGAAAGPDQDRENQ